MDCGVGAFWALGLRFRVWGGGEGALGFNNTPCHVSGSHRHPKGVKYTRISRSLIAVVTSVFGLNPKPYIFVTVASIFFPLSPNNPFEGYP